MNGWVASKRAGSASIASADCTVERSDELPLAVLDDLGRAPSYVISRWNCRPSRRSPCAKAWFAHASLSARWRRSASECQRSPRASGKTASHREAGEVANDSRAIALRDRCEAETSRSPCVGIRVTAAPSLSASKLRAEADPEDGNVRRDCAGEESLLIRRATDTAASSCTLIGPPMTIRKSTSSRSGARSPAYQRVMVEIVAMSP